MTYRKKLIEVALPLDAINKEAAYEKMPGIGPHPRGIHHWWARRPLAACRAVLFASLVDDPSNDLPEEEAKRERDRLFGILEDLVKWKNSNDDNVLGRARAEIMRSTGGNPPPVLDPFCGGGSIPLEAQRLGLEAHGSDLNPVAVLITKALIEIPPKFAGKPPINPESRAKIGNEDNWRGAQGLAEDVRYYGKWMRDEAEKRIGHLYPKSQNGEAVIAWLWARTVRCPNPACGAQMPLASNFWLSKKKGKETWVEPIVDRAEKEVRFEVKTGDGLPPDGTVNRRGVTCAVCGSVARLEYVRTEGRAGRMSQQLMSVVVESTRGRTYLSPKPEDVAVADGARPTWKSDAELAYNPRDIKAPTYGLRTYGDLFTPRQLVALTTFSDLIGEVRARVLKDGVAAGYLEDDTHLKNGDKGVQAYADALATYLAFAVDRCADFNCSLTRWVQTNEKVMNLFARQAIPMVWDFAEANTLHRVVGGWESCVDYITKCLNTLPSVPDSCGTAKQVDATSSISSTTSSLFSTDPPYYDNIGYADLADFFYVWLRRSLARIYPDLFGTLLAPKGSELVATPYRFGGNRQKAQQFFEEGLSKTFHWMREKANASYPTTIFYAFKQSEIEGSGNGKAVVASTGWETMLEGLLAARFQVTGTWPVRAEQGYRIASHGMNVLASSIVLVCRPLPAEAPPATRQEFVRALRRELPDALSVMMAENIAPVDLAQATIGPGMAIYSRYSQVVEAEGSPMRVRTALQIINGSLDEYLSEAEGDVDSHTRFAITWFEQRGMQEGPYGEAESIATARNVAVRGVVDTGILEARAGKVHLLPREKLREGWDPESDGRITAWEIVQYLIRALETEGEQGAAMLLARIGERGEAARDLAYRLYGICERKKWAEEALAYNGLVVAWPEITRLASQNPSGTEPQTTMDF